MSTESQQNINHGTASTTAIIQLKNAMRDRGRELEVAQKENDPKKREQAIKNAMQGMRDAQRTAMRLIGDQFLQGDDKKRFDVGVEVLALARDRISSDKSLIPSLGELLTDPEGVLSWSKMLSEKLGSLGELAKALGMEKELGAVRNTLNLVDKLSLDSSQLSKLSTMDMLSGGLGLAGGIADLLGGNPAIAKAKQAVDAAQKFQELFKSGDMIAGIDGILALDGLIPIPPELKAALENAKQLTERLKKFESLKPMVAKGSGVFVETKQIAALGLSQTVHGVSLNPGKGSSTVTVYGFPVWRTNSDKHICPLPGPGGAPHAPSSGGIVPKGATKTSADGYLIARHGDSTIEVNGGGLVKIVPKPEALEAAIKRVSEEADKKLKEEEKKKKETLGQKFDDPKNPKDGGKYLVLPEGQATNGNETLGDVLDPSLPANEKATVYVNGMNHDTMQDAMAEAKALANKTGKPVVLVFNQAQTGVSLNPVAQLGSLVTDLSSEDAVSSEDANNAISNYAGAVLGIPTEKEPSQKSLEQLINATSGDINIEAHSEGNLITIRAIDEAEGSINRSKINYTANGSPTGYLPKDVNSVRNEDPEDTISLGNANQQDVNVVNESDELIDPKTGKKTGKKGSGREQHQGLQYIGSQDRKSADPADPQYVNKNKK